MDSWSKLVEDNEEIAAVAMDQSAAYDIIDHQILLRKMITLGFQPQGIKWFTDYLNNRQQQVTIDGATSSNLHIGNHSVILGSVLSCALYLIYILDLPLLFHTEPHDIIQADNCKRPSVQTFVDDIMNSIRREAHRPLQ